MSKRAEALAQRLETGASLLATLASSLTDAEWQSRLPGDGRKIGVVVHHVANVYPLEIELARKMAAGTPIVGVTAKDVRELNAAHAIQFDGVTKEVAIDLLRRNSAAGAAAVRTLTDDELDRAVPLSLNADAPLTCQFMLGDHAVRHSYHHLAGIEAALNRRVRREG